MDQEENERSASFDEALAACSPSDFDGHTVFTDLTPEQRLEWLYQAASFVSENRGLARKKRLTATS